MCCRRAGRPRATQCMRPLPRRGLGGPPRRSGVIQSGPRSAAGPGNTPWRRIPHAAAETETAGVAGTEHQALKLKPALLNSANASFHSTASAKQCVNSLRSGRAVSFCLWTLDSLVEPWDESSDQCARCGGWSGSSRRCFRNKMNASSDINSRIKSVSKSSRAI